MLEDWSAYRTSRNLVNKEIRLAKKRFYQSRIPGSVVYGVVAFVCARVCVCMSCTRMRVYESVNC